MKLTDQERIEIAKSIIVGGLTTSDVRAKFHLDKETINYLVSIARAHGYDALKSKSASHTYDRDFKSNVVHSYLESNESMRNTAIKFGLNKTTVRAWILEYKEKGSEAFTEDLRGRKLPNGKPKGQSPRPVIIKSKDKAPDEALMKEYEQLKRRNSYLEMENEYLKKLDALVLTRIEREKKR